MTDDFTTAPKTQHQIIDLENDQIAGQAPGIDERDALETFNRDAFDGNGILTHDPEAAQWKLAFAADTFVARSGLGRTARTADLEEDGADIDRRVNADIDRWVTSGGEPPSVDQRYTAERLDSYSRDELLAHLNERKAQRDRVKRDMDNVHEIITTADDPDSALVTDAFATLGSLTREHATLNRVIRQLETRANRLELAEADHARIDLIDAAIVEHGMPVSLEEAGDTLMAKALWNRVVTAAETTGDEGEINVADAAERVADLYDRIWMPPSVTLDLDEDDARHLAEYLRDAAAEAEREGRKTDWTIRVVRSLDRQTQR